MATKAQNWEAFSDLQKAWPKAERMSRTSYMRMAKPEQTDLIAWAKRQIKNGYHRQYA